MGNWKRIKLLELCQRITKGTTPSTIGGDYSDNGVNYIKSESLSYSKRSLDKSKFTKISEETNKKLFRSILKENDILLSIAGAFLGKTAIVLQEDLPANTNQAVAIIRTNPKYIDYKFLYYFLNQKEIIIKINKSSAQSAQPNFNLTDLGNLFIDFPEKIEEQQAIADVLSSFDDKIELNNKIIKNLEDQAQSLYKHWFVDFEFPNEDGNPYKSSGGKFKESVLGLIPDDWNIKKIKDLSNCLLGGTPSRNNENYWNGDIPWINSGKVNEFRIVEPSEYITKEGLNKSATKLLKEKTIVIAITGATLGQISILEIESCANQSVVGVENTKDLPYEYLYCTLLNRIEDLLSNQTGGAQQHINKDNVENFNLIYNKNVVNSFHKLVLDYFDQQSKLIKENKKLEETRDYLLQKLMSGEIKVGN